MTTRVVYLKNLNLESLVINQSPVSSRCIAIDIVNGESEILYFQLNETYLNDLQEFCKSKVIFDPWPDSFCITLSDQNYSMLVKLEDMIKKYIIDCNLYNLSPKVELNEKMGYSYISPIVKKDGYDAYIKIHYSEDFVLFNGLKDIVDKSSIKRDSVLKMIIKLGKLRARKWAGRLEVRLVFEIVQGSLSIENTDYMFD